MKLDISKEKEHIVLRRKISNKLDKQYREAILNKPVESEQSIVKKKTIYKAARGGRSNGVESFPEGTKLDSPGEHRETCDIICEDLIHATVAFSAPDIIVDSIALHDDPP